MKRRAFLQSAAGAAALTLARLVAGKNTYDPKNPFRMNANVTPTL